MLTTFRSLRFKLALLLTAIFGAIQAALCLAIVMVRENELRRDSEHLLRERGALIRDSLDTPPLAAVPSALLASPSFAGVHVQVSDGNGNIVLQSPTLKNTVLDTEYTGHPADSYMNIRSADRANPIAGHTGRLLVHGYRCTLSDGRRLDVRLAMSISAVDASVAELRQIVFISFASALLISGVASWIAAGRALAPIGSIARQARTIAATDLHRRLSVPPGRDEIRDMVHVLNQMLERLEQAFVAQEQFIADVSHELKSPLTELVGQASRLRRKDASASDYRDFADRVHRNLRRTAEIIDSLLALARAESGVSPPTFLPLSVNDLVAETVQQCVSAADQAQVSLVPRLELPAADGKTPTVSGDTALLEIALSNLIRNAIRHSKPHQEVYVSVRTAGDGVHIVVRDFGPGVPPSELERIFDRFRQVHRSHDVRVNSGLGLAIARILVEAHSGTLHAENCPDGGCQFVLYLPLASRFAHRSTNLATADVVA